MKGNIFVQFKRALIKPHPDINQSLILILVNIRPTQPSCSLLQVFKNKTKQHNTNHILLRKINMSLQTQHSLNLP